MDQRDEQPAEFVNRILAVQPRLRAYIRMAVFNPSDVGDIVQEVVTTSWEHYARYDPSRPFDAWVMGIARNRVHEYRRDQSRRASPLTMDVLHLIESEADDLEHTTAQIEDALESCLSKLPAEDYQLVRTRYERSDSNRAASKLLGKSESTISRALNRIYARLLICIKQYQRGPEVQP
ncbi:MAG: sigma-70 family RNA polymerase sigma factor [Phycisphaeraceae bacterium]